MATARGLSVASPSSRPAAADDVMTEVAPLCISRSAFSSSRTAATSVTFGASCRMVSVVSTAVSSRSTATMTALALATSASAQHGVAGGRTVHSDQPVGGRLAHVLRVGLDDDDVVGRHVLLPQRAHGAAPLGAVAADDDVVLHARPPAGDLELVAGTFGEHLDRGADEHEDEQEAHRCDDQRVGEPGRRRDRRDVAVAGRRERDGRVVQRVDGRTARRRQLSL